MKKIITLISNDLFNLGVIESIKSRDTDTLFFPITSWEGLQKQLADSSIDLAIIDSSKSDLSSNGVLDKIRRNYPDLKMILLVDEDKDPVTLTFMKKGIEGVCMKSISEQDFMHAYSLVMRGKKYLDHSIAEYLLSGLTENSRIDKLTPRQSQITNLLVEGLRTADIAKKLGLAVSTVSTIKLSIFKKMSVSNVVDLASKVASFRNGEQTRPEQAL